MTSTTTASATQISTTTWKIDPAHSIAEFKVKRMMIANVKGQFSKISGALFLDESDLANSRVEATIEASSIHTRDEQRDAHLKSPDFVDVEKFPTLHFKSSDIRIVRDGELSVEGDLTIHGLPERSVSLWKGQRHLRRTHGATRGLRSLRAQRSTAMTSA
jgi:polyisoprenoid-binding protein YceI